MQDNVRRGTIIGRYQMFHKGHLDTIRHIDSQPDIDEILIGIGSSQYDRTNKNWEMPWITNPFTYEERKNMVASALAGHINKPIQILPVQDLHNCEKWADYVVHKLPKFKVFFTNTKREIDCFKKRGCEIRGIPIGGSFHAQTIREMIALGEDWREYVPRGVASFMEKINGQEILREIFQEHSDEIIEAHNFFPDYEWRTFDRLSAEDRRHILQISLASKKEYIDTYLLSASRTDINIKVRDDVLKIKRGLGEENHGIDKTATYPYRFPIRTKAIDRLLAEVSIPPIGSTVGLNNGYVTRDDFIRHLMDNQGFFPMQLHKRREVRFYNSCAIDYQTIETVDNRGETSTGNQAYESIALESRSKNRVIVSLEELGLDKYNKKDYAEFLSEISSGKNHRNINN